MGLRTFSRRASLGGLAVAGLIAGHCVAFRFFGSADPHIHHHGGHSYAPYVAAAIAGLLVALLGSLVDSRSPGKGITALSVLGLQMTGFLGLSAFDSLTAATGTEFGSDAFWAGLALQVVVAGLGALALTAFRKTARLVQRLLRRGLERPARTALEQKPPFEVALPCLAMAAGGPSFRGPPPAH